MEFTELVALDPAPEGTEASGARGRVREGTLVAAARHLAAGGILAHPTSTVYGLGADAVPSLDAEVARLKGRPPGRPLIRLAEGADAVRTRVPSDVWDARARRLAEAFWPGGLTLVLDDGSDDGLAVRVDAHPVIRRVLSLRGGLMSSTSLNRSGEPPVGAPPAARRILASMPAARTPVLFLAAGVLPTSPPSTLVSLRDGRPRLLREGAVPAEEVEAALGEALAR